MLASFEILLPSAKNVCRQHLTKTPSSTSFTVKIENQVSFSFIFYTSVMTFFFLFFFFTFSVKSS